MLVEVVEVEVTVVDVEVVATAEVVVGTVEVTEVEGVIVVVVVKEDLGDLVEVVKKLWPTGGQLSKIRS